jgi:hypothetical protein
VSKAFSDRRLPSGCPDGPGEVAPGAAQTLRVQAVFRDVDERHVQMLAAEMIARAQELGNQPECACDVDVSVQCAAPAVPLDEC